MSDQPAAEAATYTTQEMNINALSGIRTRDPRNRVVADLRLRPHGHRDRHINMYWGITKNTYIYNWTSEFN